eukprot:gene14259-20232_t
MVGKREAGNQCKGCPWCLGHDDVAGKARRLKCREFKELKSLTSPSSYLEVINLLFKQPPDPTAMDVLKELEGLKKGQTDNEMSELAETLAKAHIGKRKKR